MYGKACLKRELKMNYEYEIKKLKGWKVYYTNMYRKTGRNVYYNKLKKIMLRFMSMRTKIVLSYTQSEISYTEFKTSESVRFEMDNQADEVREELKILNLAFAC